MTAISRDHEDAIELTWRNYDRIAARFHERTREMGNDRIREFVDLLRERPDPRVLDVGCGAGRDVETFAEAGIDAVGIDLSGEMVALARENVPGAAFERMDMRRLAFPAGTFDGVWSKDSLHHVPRAEMDALLGEIRRVLEADGLLFVEVREGETEGLERTDDYDEPIRRFVSYWREDELADRLRAAGFAVVESTAEADRWTDTGEKRPFRKLRVLCRSTGSA